MTQLTDISEIGGLTRPASWPVQKSLPSPDAGEDGWPAWKVTVFVVGFCGVFWAGIGYFVSLIAA